MSGALVVAYGAPPTGPLRPDFWPELTPRIQPLIPFKPPEALPALMVCPECKRFVRSDGPCLFCAKLASVDIVEESPSADTDAPKTPEVPPPFDAVNPDYYTSSPSGIECIDVVEHLPFCRGAAIKYLWRAGLKTDDALTDLRKARWFVEREIARLEKLQGGST